MPRSGVPRAQVEPDIVQETLEWVELGHVDLVAWRHRAAASLPVIAGDLSPAARTILVAEIHPAVREGVPGSATGLGVPEGDDATLRALASFNFFPRSWTATTTSRNYRAIVGRGDSIVVAWSGNADYWGNDLRDRSFREFGDDRTIGVVARVAAAAQALIEVSTEADRIAEDLADWGRSARSGSGSEQPARDAPSTRKSGGARRDQVAVIDEIDGRIRLARARLRQEALKEIAGHAITSDDSLARLGDLHAELCREFLPERVTSELDRELGHLQHDVEFEFARRADEQLINLVQGSDDSQRARFVQSVVLLVLAGAALFTGIVAIPGEIFPDSYPRAGLFSVAILVGAMATGFVLHEAYRRPRPGSRWVKWASVVLLLVFTVGLLAGLGRWIPDIAGFVVAVAALGGFGFALALSQTSES